MAGAPRSNHTGQVIVYTVSNQKQTTVIDSERGKQVLRSENVLFIISRYKKFKLTGLVALLDRVVLRERPVLCGCGQQWRDRPAAGRGTDVHE